MQPQFIDPKWCSDFPKGNMHLQAMYPKLCLDPPKGSDESLSTETVASSASSVSGKDMVTSSRQILINRGIPWPFWKIVVGFLIFAYTSLALVGAIYLSVTRKLRQPSPQQCDRSRPPSMVESQFEIDIIFVNQLSFTKAKLIDLAWDMCLGHGGRLLHGWLFYYVACRAVTWMLEYSALPYWLLLDILFRPDSLSSLRSLAKWLSGKHQLRTLLILILLSYGIGHVLFFGTIWSASAGYLSAAVGTYMMSDSH
ncbi:hypothetical protein B0T16DRAFT_114963 [Cercophora newfieldiana]|uniref:Uncharacterized protein n=1 Tax=Cercophora newfieldiana TaxID=92897 RepID=A0AA39Y975_9PEZI|nr:hypothetical protein B0T16DRAFT_114963 [Cercophora newfieldiana]